MKKIAIVTAIFVATAAKAEVITKDEALSFGYEIVVWAACGQRFATLDLAKFLNKGAKLKDFEALRAEILHGKELAKESLAQKGKPAFCGKDDSTSRAIRDHASDAETLGFVSVEDELCGTHSYKAMIEGMKKRGELYPGLLKDYAEEFAKGRRLQFHVFEREGETKLCKEGRRIEREDADFERITRKLEVYEPPSYNE